MEPSPVTDFVADPSLAGVPARAVEPFAPPSDAWRRVSPKLTIVRRITSSLTLALLFIPAALVLWFVLPDLRWLPPLVLAVGLGWWVGLWTRARRAVRATGWARRDNDLCIVKGLMFRELSIIPFGRIQVVRVNSGPLLRAFGLANVSVVTASAAADAVIPGLPGDEARVLRDLIIELSDAEGSGL